MSFVCNICRDTLTSENGERKNDSAGVGPQVLVATMCGHLFHRDCLNQNFQTAESVGDRSRNTCPTCKSPVNINNLIRIYPSEVDDENDIRSRKEIEKLSAELVQLTIRNESLEQLIQSLERKNCTAAAVAAGVSPLGSLTHSKVDIKEKRSTFGGLIKGKEIVWLKDECPQIGIVKWLGSINQLDFAGIEFENEIGNRFPEAEGKELFTFKEGHGRLVPVRELILFSDYYQ